MEDSSKIIQGNLIIEQAEELPGFGNFGKRLDYLEHWLKTERRLNETEINGFENSCPLLLNDEQLTNPRIVLENFFNGNDLISAKAKLKYWFKTALTEELRYENGNELLFFHNQLIQLFHSGYLIALKQHSIDDDFDQVDLLNSDALICCLDKAEKSNPLKYLSVTLTSSNLRVIRFGMQEWLYSALSNRSSISQLDSKFIFEQYELLEKLLEALFLISSRVLN
ncbi:hypothetical protein ACFOG5_17735 [Pedobacter fastidiosus]|uniref:Uncharacterized protein n=1 Tax=Pedobacter fastidiosus TaxID=2765361 RepID=A0ABR7KS74_9SPHI|nr:hypothetical protein [Pedobacter fastidiosus]MBC6110573.1 hypothetical protein [Pedobacter fastidiosus]